MASVADGDVDCSEIPPPGPPVRPAQLGRPGEAWAENGMEATGGSSASTAPPPDRDTRSASGLLGAHATARPQSAQGLTRQDLLERGMAPQQADAVLIQQFEQEIMDTHFVRCIVCFSFTFFLVVLTTIGCQLYLFVSFFTGTERECRVPLRLWACVVFGLWTFRMFRCCVDRFICCYRPQVEGEPPPRRIRLKEAFVLIFDFAWVVCVGVGGIAWDAKQGKLPACEDADPSLYMAAKVYVLFSLASTIWLWLSVVGLRSMLRLLMRRGLLSTSNAAPPKAIEKNTEVVELTEADLAESSSCPICMEDFALGSCKDKPVARSKLCGHLFHKQCLKNWLKVARSCPLCRMDMAEGA